MRSAIALLAIVLGLGLLVACTSNTGTNNSGAGTPPANGSTGGSCGGVGGS